MGTDAMNLRTFRPADRKGFTLVEMLVVIAIIGVLMMILAPMLGPAMDRARRVACGNHLSQCYKVALQYAADNNGRLPPANADNPATFHLAATEIMTTYMEQHGLPPIIWYCPALVRQDPLNRGLHNWRNPNTSQSGYGEFRIGYCYNGAAEGAVDKYRVPFPVTSADLNGSSAITADVCSTPRPSPVQGRDVKFWYTFPHNGAGKPQVCNVGMGDGSVQAKPKEILVHSYAYIGATELYW